MGTDACYGILYDFNLDGNIDALDFAILNANLGVPAAAAPAGSISGLGNTIGYAGYVWDPSLGGQASGMFLARHRWYAPELGRWVSRDPIGYADGMNLYGYVGGMPLVLVDPMGLSAMEAMRQRHEFGLVREDSIELASDTMDAMERPLQTAWCNRHAIADYFSYWLAQDYANAEAAGHVEELAKADAGLPTEAVRIGRVIGR